MEYDSGDSAEDLLDQLRLTGGARCLEADARCLLVLPRIQDHLAPLGETSPGEEVLFHSQLVQSESPVDKSGNGEQVEGVEPDAMVVQGVLRCPPTSFLLDAPRLATAGELVDSHAPQEREEVLRLYSLQEAHEIRFTKIQYDSSPLTACFMWTFTLVGFIW